MSKNEVDDIETLAEYDSDDEHVADAGATKDKGKAGKYESIWIFFFFFLVFCRFFFVKKIVCWSNLLFTFNIIIFLITFLFFFIFTFCFVE